MIDPYVAGHLQLLKLYVPALYQLVDWGKGDGEREGLRGLEDSPGLFIIN